MDTAGYRLRLNNTGRVATTIAALLVWLVARGARQEQLQYAADF
jgi:hypothetical protein